MTVRSEIGTLWYQTVSNATGKSQKAKKTYLPLSSRSCKLYLRQVDKKWTRCSYHSLEFGN